MGLSAVVPLSRTPRKSPRLSVPRPPSRGDRVSGPSFRLLISKFWSMPRS